MRRRHSPGAGYQPITFRPTVTTSPVPVIQIAKRVSPVCLYQKLRFSVIPEKMFASRISGRINIPAGMQAPQKGERIGEKHDEQENCDRHDGKIFQCLGIRPQKILLFEIGEEKRFRRITVHLDKQQQDHTEFRYGPVDPSASIASPRGIRYLIICLSMNWLATPATPLTSNGNE